MERRRLCCLVERLRGEEKRREKKEERRKRRRGQHWLFLLLFSHRLSAPFSLGRHLFAIPTTGMRHQCRATHAEQERDRKIKRQKHEKRKKCAWNHRRPPSSLSSTSSLSSCLVASHALLLLQKHTCTAVPRQNPSRAGAPCRLLFICSAVEEPERKAGREMLSSPSSLLCSSLCKNSGKKRGRRKKLPCLREIVHVLFSSLSVPLSPFHTQASKRKRMEKKNKEKEKAIKN